MPSFLLESSMKDVTSKKKEGGKVVQGGVLVFALLYNEQEIKTAVLSMQRTLLYKVSQILQLKTL